jgi:biotin carboxylase
MSELIGHPALTPYPGGWCGNDLHPTGFSMTIRKTAQDMTVKLGNALYKNGYKGYFEVDYLIDRDTQNVYFGELNPRISGITPMTSSSPYAEQTAPLFLLHLTEFAGIEFALDATTYNHDVLRHGAQGASGQLIFKYVDPELKVIAHAPEGGIYTLDESGRLTWKKHAIHRDAARGENEGFLMQIKSKDEYVYHGEDMAIMFINTPVMGKKGSLTHMANQWIKALRNAYILRDLTDEERAIIDRYQNPGVRLKWTHADG